MSYPMIRMVPENFESRLSFIQKVYSIIIFQLLLTVAVVSIFLFVPPIANFFNNYVPDYFIIIVAIFAYLSVEYCQYQKDPLGYLFLLIFTVSFASFIGTVCTSLPSGKILKEAVTLTTVVVISLSLYTFWATKRGYDFNYLGTFLYGNMFVVFLLILVKILYPSGILLFIVYGWLASITFYGYIVYHTNNLIKSVTYAKYISLSISLYLDVIITFLCVLTLYGVAYLIKRRM